MGKVNHNAKLEHENLHNLKLMQYGMEQANIPEKFDVDNAYVDRHHCQEELQSYPRDVTVVA